MWIVKVEGEVYASGFDSSAEAHAFVVAHKLRGYCESVDVEYMDCE